jgi:seryl-tRNA synthetase
MLDYKFIKDKLDEVKKNIAERYMDADADLVVSLYDEKIGLQRETEELRKKRNDNALAMKGKLDPETRAVRIEEGKLLKDKIAQAEARLTELDNRLAVEGAKIPNMAHPEAPRGKEDKDNLEVKRVGEPTNRAKGPRPAGSVHGSHRLSTATGFGHQVLLSQNEAVILEMALVRYTLDTLMEKGFTLFQTPDIARPKSWRESDSIPGGPNPTSTPSKAKEPALSAPQRSPWAATTRAPSSTR